MTFGLRQGAAVSFREQLAPRPVRELGESRSLDDSWPQTESALSPQSKNTNPVFLPQVTWKERSPCQVQKKEESPLLAAGESGCHSNELLPKSTHYMAFELDFLCVYTLVALIPPCLPSTCLPGFSPRKAPLKAAIDYSFQGQSRLVPGMHNIYLLTYPRKNPMSTQGKKTSVCSGGRGNVKDLFEQRFDQM